MIKKTNSRRKGAVLVEYALLIAGVALTAVLAVAVLGHKTGTALSLMAVVLPGANPDDNAPIRHVEPIPLNTQGPAITLDATRMVGTNGGIDRWQSLFGTNASGQAAGDLLILDEGP